MDETRPSGGGDLQVARSNFVRLRTDVDGKPPQTEANDRVDDNDRVDGDAAHSRIQRRLAVSAR
jgi:hypothetical protein